MRGWEMLAFGMPGGIEFMIIFVVALLLFGAKKLPELARGMGKAMGEFKAARREFEDEIRRAEREIREEPKKISQTHSVEPEVVKSIGTVAARGSEGEVPGRTDVAS